MPSKVATLFLVQLRNALFRKAKPKYNPSASDILLKRIDNHVKVISSMAESRLVDRARVGNGKAGMQHQILDAYEFYWRDPIKGYQLIGILPERRKTPERITQKSVMNWAKIYFRRNMEMNDMFFFQVTMDKNTERIFRSNPFLVTQKQV